MNVLVIQGHPDEESYNVALGRAYIKGARAAGAAVEELVVSELPFDPNLHFGYRKRTELEPCLLKAQELIRWADHLVIVYPIWWGSLPALLKGFFDRVFLPGFAFKKREGSLFWDKYLTGKSARIICTADQPGWFYRLRYQRPSYYALKALTLEYCGIKPVRTTFIGPIRLSKDTFRASWLEKVQKLGRELK